MRATDMSPKEQTLHNLLQTTQWLLHREADFLKRFELSAQQYSLLKLLKASHPQPVSVKKLKEEMPDRMSDVSRIVERMRKKGLLNRVTSEIDRRAVEITLTGKGLGVLYEINQSSENTLIQGVPNLNSKEIGLLNELLQKMKSEIK